jgi:hypothetical protein
MPGRDGGPVLCGVDSSGTTATPKPRSRDQLVRDPLHDAGLSDDGPLGSVSLSGPPFVPPRRPRRPGPSSPAAPAADPLAEQGSQTTEYALLLIVAATVTTIAVAWAKQGGVKSVFDGVVAQVLALFGIGAG